MLCATENKNEIYNELAKRLKAGETIDTEIVTVCRDCRPSSPVICVELCPIWRLKRELHEAPKPSVKHNLIDILRTTKDSRRLKILKTLMERPYSLKELRVALRVMGIYNDHKAIRNYTKPLVDAGFIKVEGDQYKITPWGKNASNILTTSEITELPPNLKWYDEKILAALLSEPKSHEELVEIVPRESLYRSLRRLQSRDLIAKSNLSGRIFYFKAKRRPTRKLTPTEMKIFKALPKEGISVKDLHEKIGVNRRRIYKYLRRLRYKRHVKKGQKKILYKITDAGRSLAQSLNVANNLIQAITS